MIEMSCEEIVNRSPWRPRISGGILEDECSELYDDATRKLIGQFRTGREAWSNAGKNLLEKRIKWFESNSQTITDQLHGTEVEKAYQLILLKLGISEREVSYSREIPRKNRLSLNQPLSRASSVCHSRSGYEGSLCGAH